MGTVKFFKRKDLMKCDAIYIIYKGHVYYSIGKDPVTVYFTESEFERYFVLEKLKDVTDDVIANFEYHEWIERIEGAL